MKWHYTEGKLHVDVDGTKHQFTLEDIIKQSSAYRERRNKTIITFIVSSLLVMGLQLMGAGIPKDQNLYFYIGYFLTPCVLGGIIATIVSVYIRFTKKEGSELDTMFQNNPS